MSYIIALFTVAGMTTAAYNGTVDTAGDLVENGIVRLAETVIVVEAPTQAHKSWVCGNWEDSKVGGSYKRCEWR